MTTRKYFSSAFLIDQRINSKLEQVQSLRELATKATTTLSDMPKGGSRNVTRMSDIIAKMVDLEAEINREIDTLVDLKADIGLKINTLSDARHRTVLELRYLCYKPWNEIADTLGIEIHYAYKLHAEAIKKIALRE
jgi:DNA-directed RNA polymerase specialized sigma subunit